MVLRAQQTQLNENEGKNFEIWTPSITAGLLKLYISIINKFPAHVLIPVYKTHPGERSHLKYMKRRDLEVDIRSHIAARKT